MPGEPSDRTPPAQTLVVWCPDWPVVAAAAEAGLPPQIPVAVLAANRVIACSAVARAEGVARDMSKRPAQARCPELVVFEDDQGRDARLFEPVAAAVEDLAPGIEVYRPGVVAVPARGPAGYFGGAEAAAERLVDHVAAAAGVECQVGVAGGLFAATLAAHRGLVVPDGDTAAFLAPLGIGELDQPAERRGKGRTELVDLLRRLGLRTLGAFAAVPERDVASRFGGPAVLAHRLARGLEERPPARRRPPADLAVTEELDPPIERVDTAAFAARALAERLHEKLAGRGLACTRLAIHARTERGEELCRVWRCAEPLTPAGLADRVRWQLDGWLTGRGLRRTAGPSAGLTLLRLDPEEVVDATALQLGLWAGAGQDQGENAERAGRVLVRVQGMLGPEAVVTPVLGGGRGPADRVRLVPWGDERSPGTDPELPWPGRLPPPFPATVPDEPIPVQVFDEEGTEVGVTGRHRLTAEPYRVAVDGRPPRRVRGWAGPWTADEQWWEPAKARRRARIQVVLAGEPGKTEETALLLVREGGRWTVEGEYD
ncbi:DNA polymerase Y family protein [Solihabitans fulvus]|uniref:DNA polymerase Y family protein n=1 Tax=Solihabitans fulvus TaxID=1892852 RepID=A0A5B2XLH3_9PSEU|nr:DNA polymerase Y family protein [Solihabitans fulvus]KAA2264627.1 DNA polymerase Y family protein [Solihabitans fulvus]